MFNFIDIYNCIPVSGRVGMGPSALLYPGVYDAVKTALLQCYTPISYVIGKRNDGTFRIIMP